MFFKWLEKKCYPDHPSVATAEEWCEWEKKEREKPICYFLVNTIPEWFNTNIISKISNVYYWFQYRLHPAYKYHLIKTGLKPGYHEIDNRMINGMFNILKEFCENEQPYHDWCWNNKGEKFISGKEAALKSLKWQKELVYTEDDIFNDNDKHLIGQLTPQAEKAIELETLYLWWVEIYPNRVDPYDCYEDPYFNNLIETKESVMKILCNRPPEEEIKATKIYHQRDILEKQYIAEDEEMLIRLIKIRNSMWT